MASTIAMTASFHGDEKPVLQTGSRPASLYHNDVPRVSAEHIREPARVLHVDRSVGRKRRLSQLLELFGQDRATVAFAARPGSSRRVAGDDPESVNTRSSPPAVSDEEQRPSYRVLSH